eukprot:SAG22_NODE_367_length_11613_cov_11.955011_9_plen_367_part_00
MPVVRRRSVSPVAGATRRAVDLPAQAAAQPPHVTLASPLAGARFGARIDGADLGKRPLTAAEASWLVAALWEHQVLHIPGQRLPPGRLEQLANHFGAPVPEPRWAAVRAAAAAEGAAAPSPFPHVLRSEGDSSGNNSAAGWHADLDFEREPCTVTMLHCQVAPLRGGGTNFADTASACAALSAAERAELAALECVHLPRPFFSPEMRRDPANTATHPLVRPQPVTGRPALFLPAEDFYPALPERPQGLAGGAGLVGAIQGMAPAAGDALMKRLLRHCTQPPFTAAHTWCDSDLVIWDNATVLHRAEILGKPGQGLRLHHRVSVKGVPVSRLPRDTAVTAESDEWVEEHVRGYRTPLGVLELARHCL